MWTGVPLDRVERAGLLVTRGWNKSIAMRHGLPPKASAPWSASEIPPKFHELNRRAAIKYHRDREAFRRRIRGSENFLALNRGLKIVYFKGDVRDGLDQGVDRAIGLEAHPLNAARTRLKCGDVHLEFFQIILAGPRNIRRDADVVISPTTR